MPIYDIWWLNYQVYQILGVAAQYGMYVEQWSLAIQWLTAIGGSGVQISDKFWQPRIKKLNRITFDIGGLD